MTEAASQEASQAVRRGHAVVTIAVTTVDFGGRLRTSPLALRVAGARIAVRARVTADVPGGHIDLRVSLLTGDAMDHAGITWRQRGAATR